MKEIHYYELCFYHDEDDHLATERRCSYCIKTEIPPVISNKVAFAILLEQQKGDIHFDLWNHLTCVMEISETEALECFYMEEINNRIEGEYGVYYV